MLSPLDERWPRFGSQNFRGGQGKSYIGQRSDGTYGFVKQLIRPTHMPSRRRFLREVTSYQTLDCAGIPKLLEHNSEQWANTSIQLYLVLEYIDGASLGDHIRSIGPIAFDIAVNTVDNLLATLHRCHVNDIVHRDIKPQNIVLRKSNLMDPLLVDFGLSFNSADAESSDLTRVNEEVGNRFLRLPEHSTGGRSPISDVTQMAGILYFLLTGLEPRVLVDHSGNMPHQREGVRELLGVSVPDVDVRRQLLSLFDRAFHLTSSVRYQTALQLREGLASVRSSVDGRQDLDGIVKRLEAVTLSPRHKASTASAAMLGRYTASARLWTREFAAANGLVCSYGGGPDDFDVDPPHAIVRFGFAAAGSIARKFVDFRFELVGSSEVRCSAEGEVIWRGSDPEDTELRDEILRLTALDFLDS